MKVNYKLCFLVNVIFYKYFMKKIFLFSIIALVVLVVILGVGFYFLKNRLQDDGGNIPISDDKYNFDYDDGEKPWATHMKTDINTTFEATLNGDQYLQTLKCAGDNTDLGKNPFGPVEPICLQGGGAKMIVPNSSNKTSYSIFNSPVKGGLLAEEYIVSDVPLHFFDSGYSTEYYVIPFFVIPFNGYEVPTYYPIESQGYLFIWKQVFQKMNGISDTYFNNHIFVIGTSVDKFDIDGKVEKTFFVTYYYSVDWAYIKLTDSFTYSFEGIDDGITLEELEHDVGVMNFNQTKYQQILNINKLKPIDRVATKEQIKSAIKNASSLLWFDVNEDMVVLEDDGQLEISLYGTIDDAANKCLSGTIILENARVLEVVDTPCRILQ